MRGCGAHKHRIDKLYEGTALSSTGIPACATSCYLRKVDETRKPKNAFFALACLARTTTCFDVGTGRNAYATQGRSRAIFRAALSLAITGPGR
jgi:hypothetical protein